MSDLGTITDGTFTAAHSINEPGHVVGESSTANGDTRALLWTPRRIFDLRGVPGSQGQFALAINNQDVKSVEQLTQLLNQFEKARSVALLIRRGDGSLYVPLRLDGG